MPPQRQEVRRAYRRPVTLGPRPKPKPKAKPRKHFAVIASIRYQSYACPSCGMLGSLSDGIAHAVANQFDVPAFID